MPLIIGFAVIGFLVVFSLLFAFLLPAILAMLKFLFAAGLAVVTALGATNAPPAPTPTPTPCVQPAQALLPPPAVTTPVPVVAPATPVAAAPTTDNPNREVVVAIKNLGNEIRGESRKLDKVIEILSEPPPPEAYPQERVGRPQAAPDDGCDRCGPVRRGRPRRR